MLLSVALLAVGSLLLLAGVAWLSLPVALVVCGSLLVGYGLIREAGNG